VTILAYPQNKTKALWLF